MITWAGVVAKLLATALVCRYVLACAMLDFAYQLQLSNRRRTVQLAIRNGEVIVRAPQSICRQWLQSWLLQKQDWVNKILAIQPVAAPICWLTRSTVLLGGTAVAYHWRLAKKSALTRTEQAVTLDLAERISEKRYPFYLQKLWREYLTTEAERVFTPLVAEHASRMQLQPKAVIIGDWRSRWGYCKQSGELGFNCRLMQAPLWVARYVVVHELAHLRYMNHSAAFWQLVHAYEPDYLAAKAWLNKHQHELLA
jgi:predicted metal-dependent hydrolase